MIYETILFLSCRWALDSNLVLSTGANWVSYATRTSRETRPLAAVMITGWFIFCQIFILNLLLALMLYKSSSRMDDELVKRRQQKKLLMTLEKRLKYHGFYIWKRNTLLNGKLDVVQFTKKVKEVFNAVNSGTNTVNSDSRRQREMLELIRQHEDRQRFADKVRRWNERLILFIRWK